MYVIVHEDAIECSSILKDVGYELIIVKKPIEESEIKGDFLRKNIRKEWCCGIDEFIKLYAYDLRGGSRSSRGGSSDGPKSGSNNNNSLEPIIVHVDIDFLFLKPMDNIYDSILYDKDSPEGKLARSKLELELRINNTTDPLPTKQIGAFITRDWAQVHAGRKPLFQAGFMVVKRNPQITQELFNIIREGNYSGGWQRENGWGSLGYGSYVGAMAMQGLIAYYYDQVRQPADSVELNQCNYNHMGMNVLYAYAPNPPRPKDAKRGKCRNNLDYCEDCRITSLDSIYNIHFTQCRKPWNCIGIGAPGGTSEQGKKIGKYGDAIDTHSGNYGTYCICVQTHMCVCVCNLALSLCSCVCLSIHRLSDVFYS